MIFNVGFTDFYKTPNLGRKLTPNVTPNLGRNLILKVGLDMIEKVGLDMTTILKAISNMSFYVFF